MSEVVVIGSDLDALICSASLLDLGVKHEIFVDPERVGGHFAGWKPRCGSLVDAGMVALEEDARRVTEHLPLSDYQGQVGVAARPFLRSAFDRLRDLGFSTKPLSVGVYTHGRVVPDYFISDDLTYLRNLDETTGRRARPDFASVQMHRLESEILRKAEPQSPLKGKALGSVLDATWGTELSDYLFGGLLRELDPRGTVRARDHRLVWIPLYWPSTIARALDIGIGIDHATFLTSMRGAVARDIGKVAERVLSSIRNTDVSKSEFSTPNGGPSASSLDQRRELVVDFRVARVQVPGSIIRIVHFCTESTRNETIFLRVPDEGLFRVNWRSGTEGSDVCLEFGVSSSDWADAQLIEYARDYLIRQDTRTTCEGDCLRGRVGLSSRHEIAVPSAFAPTSSYFGANRSANFNESLLRGLSAAQHIFGMV